MQDSEGKLELCPFRIRREQSYDNPNIFTEMFMDCLKEQCMCYSKNVYSDGEVRREFTIVYYGTASNSEVVIDDESSTYAWISLIDVLEYPMAASQKRRIEDVLNFYKTGEKKMG